MILLSFTPDEIAFTSREGVGNLRIVRWACSPADKVIEWSSLVLRCAWPISGSL
jgi:hypothetical protein